MSSSRASVRRACAGVTLDSPPWTPIFGQHARMPGPGQAGPGQAGIGQRLGFPLARSFRLFGLPVLTGVLACGHELADIVAAPAGILERHLWVRAKAQQAFLAVAPVPQTPPPGAGRTGLQYHPPAIADLARFAYLDRRFEGCANGLVCEDVSCRHDRVTFCHIGPIGCSYPVCYPVSSRMCVDLPSPMRTWKKPQVVDLLGALDFPGLIWNYVWWRFTDSNRGPVDYDSIALTD